MKKIYHNLFILVSVMTIVFVSMIPVPITVNAQPADIQAESAILVDFETGKILYEKNADVALPPASMTKMMTEYLVLEAIHEGKISWDTTTEISDYAYDISYNNDFSGIGLRKDYPYTVRELYDAMAIYSDNATTIALAELIAGSEGEFVKMMNEKGKEMGLPDFQFVNSTGLSNRDLGDNYPKGTDPEADNLLSARSAALLAYHLIKDYPEVLEHSSVRQKEFEGKMMTNWNWMLPGMPGYLEQYGYEGVDGLKTGWTDLAGYCFTGTAERSDRRLISVVMRTASKEARFLETQKLLDYGFSQFERKEIFPSGYQIDEQSVIPVTKGKENQVEIESAAPVELMIKKGEKDQYQAVFELDESLLTEDGELTAPVEEGTQVGRMRVTYTGDENFGYLLDELEQQATIVPVVTKDGVEKASWFALFFRAIGEFFADIFSSVTNGIKGLF
ncbi:MAG: D-alanyl-D-alanine carboxypeptidase [Bacillaceae bacterium]|nr:D-alanyl-D-alanine carboxypeptidase [Bacillaceae bacterium]